ncbi:MAG TPA: tetratricopeptide repeat protein [Candidatus Melainabacteria bacterium]|jgi:predicted aspartyl protease|nr:tetratricopeptide repeat protein [Candidatus Melainabacteria bacterium]HIN65274.1 tetratricopeptide repeat protein [Candidatus Obscuribacterales bacterium]
MKKLQAKLLVFLVLVLFSGFARQAAMAGEEYTQGVKLLGQKRFDEATKLLKKAVTNEPNNSNALYYLAVGQHYQGKTADALVNYQLILKKFPGTDAANRAAQVVGSIRLAPGTTDAQWYPKAATAGAGTSTQNSVRTYAGAGSSSSVRSYSSSNLPDQATIFFEKGDAELKVDCYINNRPIKMVFDTGATGIVVGKNQLQEMGIRPPEGEPTGQSGGSSNASLQSYWLMPADVKVGTIQRQNFPVKVLSYNSAPPLLGQSFIQDFDYSIDRNAGAIRLRKKGSSSSGSAGTGYTVPFTWEGPKMVVNVEVNGRPYPMYFDTGNSASAISMGMNDVKALNLSTDEGEAVSHTGVTGSGSGLKFKVKRIKMGPIEKYNCDVTANYSSLGKPLVGQDLYEGYEYTVDNDRMVIHFIRR